MRRLAAEVESAWPGQNGCPEAGARVDDGVAYVLRCREVGEELSLTLWEMSQVRDKMMLLGAAHATHPTQPPPALTARCPSGLEGIPAYKLAGLDGWFVRCDEIAEALTLLAGAPSERQLDREIAQLGTAWPDPELWRRWIGFLRHAVASSGFDVIG
jgi:hypothetical protein